MSAVRARRALAAGCLALACVPSFAQADNYVAKDGYGNLITFTAKLVTGVLHPLHVVEGLDSSTVAPAPLTVDHSDSGLWAHLTNLSTLSTAALQTTGNGYLSTLATASASQATAANQATGNTSLATIATNSGTQATAANQTTANTSLATIATNSGTQATAANQSTGNTSLSTIVTNSGTTNTDLGPLGATACTTDTGSCSLNALMQRLAQRLTTLNTTLGSPFQAGAGIANLPATVDTNTGAPSASTLRVVNANPTAVVTGQYKITASAVAIGASTALVNGVVIKAKTGNAGSVWIGGAGVTATDDGTGNGYKLLPGESASFAATNVANLYAIGTANDVIYFEGN